MLGSLIVIFLQIRLSGLPDTVRIPLNRMIQTIHETGRNRLDVRKMAVLQHINFLGIQDRDLESKQIVTRCGRDTYVCFNGTGIVYRLVKADSEWMVLVREDATKYMGYNFNSIRFSLQDTLYSFGGNGFWQYNGALTFFDRAKKEWEILRLNQEVPVNSEFFYLDGVKGILYFVVIPFQESITNREHHEFGVYKLDVRKREVTKLGDVPEGSSFDFRLARPIFTSEFLKGLVIQNKKDYLLLDFSNNRISRLTNTQAISHINGGTQNTVYYEFSVGDTLFNVYANGTLSNRVVSLADFTPLDERVYDEGRLMPYALLLLGVVTPLFFVIRRRRSRPSVDNGDVSPDTHNFTSVEWDVILTMVGNHKANRLTKSDEISRVMGLQKKSLEVQKKLRTEIIHRINHNFRIAAVSDSDLVIRIKSEEDRRYIEYDISEEGIEWLKQVQRSGTSPSA